MYNFKLDSTGDIIIGRGATRTSGVGYTLQLVKCRLQFFLGEWELDTTLGVPYRTSVIGKNQDLGLIRGIFLSQILNTPGVAQVGTLILSVDKDTRKLTVRFIATTTAGESFTGSVS